MHCDRSNDGPSAIVALGDFTGGRAARDADDGSSRDASSDAREASSRRRSSNPFRASRRRPALGRGPRGEGAAREGPSLPEERCAYAAQALEAWSEDWPLATADMAKACAERSKPGEVLGDGTAIPGLRLGFARLRSPERRGDERRRNQKIQGRRNSGQTNPIQDRGWSLIIKKTSTAVLS